MKTDFMKVYDLSLIIKMTHVHSWNLNMSLCSTHFLFFEPFPTIESALTEKDRYGIFT